MENLFDSRVPFLKIYDVVFSQSNSTSQAFFRVATFLRVLSIFYSSAQLHSIVFYPIRA